TEWNPLRAGTATVDFEVTNEGNTRIIAEGEVTLGGHTATFPEPGEPTQALLPGESRELSVTVGGVWPLVRPSGPVTLTPRATPLDGGAAPVPSSTAEVAVWALPWPQLLVLAGLALIVTALAWNRLRSRRRLSAMLDRAREEGRREVARGAQPRPYHNCNKPAGIDVQGRCRSVARGLVQEPRHSLEPRGQVLVGYRR